LLAHVLRECDIRGRSLSPLVFGSCCNRTPPFDHLNVANMWKGVVERTNQVGYFDRANTAPYIEIPAIDSSLLRSRTARPGCLVLSASCTAGGGSIAALISLLLYCTVHLNCYLLEFYNSLSHHVYS